MELYRPRCSSISERYFSEIAFVNTLPMSVVQRKVFYVQSDKNSGFYYDKNDYLKNIFWDSKKNDKDIKDISKGYINTIYPATKYFSYVKVLRDKQHPQLEGQIMIFQFGTSIMKKIEKYFDGSPILFNNTFGIIIKLSQGFPNFDESDFTDNTVIVSDPNLNLDLEPMLNFKTIIPGLQQERKEKLEKLNKLCG
jgi:hypothetical protein